MKLTDEVQIRSATDSLPESRRGSAAGPLAFQVVVLLMTFRLTPVACAHGTRETAQTYENKSFTSCPCSTHVLGGESYGRTKQPRDRLVQNYYTREQME